MDEKTNNPNELSLLSRHEIDELEKKIQFHKTRHGTRLAFHEYGDLKGHPIFFYGAADKFVPPKFSEYLAQNAKNVRINMLAGQGHFYHLVCGHQMLQKVAALFYADKP